MKKLPIVIFVFIIFLFYLFFLSNNYSKKAQEKSILPTKTQLQISPTIIQAEKNHTSDLFVPYWSSISADLGDNNYKNLIYFGVAVNQDGVEKGESGYKNLALFVKKVNQKNERILGIRMLNQNINEQVLGSKKIQDVITNNVVSIAEQNNFEGILLDFEYSALNFEDVSRSITNFISNFSRNAHNKNLKFFVTAYGDAFYRARPFDIKKISENVDGIYVLAYDFHKAKGNPGPNFPFKKLDDEDYDFQTMVKDFLSNVSPDKLIITFGFFGYDWTVGEKGMSLKQAEPISLNDAKQKFLDSCEEKDCTIKTNASKEVEVTYLDSSKQKHNVWLETEESANLKKEFLFSKGIGKTAVWAYSYF